MNVTRRMALCFVLLVALIPTANHAQDNYPSRPIRIIVPFGAGGSPDTFTRMFAKALTARIGQNVIVENRPGANSIVGAGYVAKAAPDGYTLLYGTNSGLSAARALMKSLPYDPIQDFAGIMIVQEGYFVLLVNAADKALSFPQFIDRVRKNPERHPIGGSSTTAEVSNKLMENAAKLQHTYIRYKESSTMMTDLIGGRLKAAFNPVNASLPLIEAGKISAIAVTAPHTLPALPNTPPLAATLPGVVLATWTGFFAPAKTPKHVIDYLHRKMAEVAREPDILKWNENAGRALFLTPAEVDAFVKKDEPRWLELFRSAGIQPE